MQRLGLDLQLFDLPPWEPRGPKKRFPNAISDYFASAGLLLRELRMLEFINQVTDRPRWWEEVHDEQIVGRWRMEACGTEEQQAFSSQHLSEACFEYCIEELRDMGSCLDLQAGGVHVLRTKAIIVKADFQESESLRWALKHTIYALDGVPDRFKDWRAGTDRTVLDLLDPSLFALNYNVTHALDDTTVPLDHCLEYAGRGDLCWPVIGRPWEIDRSREVGYDGHHYLFPLDSFQWLPTDIVWDENGSPVITSYINNLHPVKNRSLYPVLQSAIEQAIPYLEQCLSPFYHDRLRRLDVPPDRGRGDTRHFLDIAVPEQFVQHKQFNEDDGHDDMEDYEDAWLADQQAQEEFSDWVDDHPDEVQVYQPSLERPYKSFEDSDPINLRTNFPDGLQVIFKLTNVHLRPEKPTYDGSNWHVEGALNERICATALFCYDIENVRETHVEFRQESDAMRLVEDMNNRKPIVLEKWFGMKENEATIQTLGKVAIRQGRWIAFPNVMQHKVGPFVLQDPTQPGHCKMLAMFLVDPHLKIISTANVAPQQRDWWAEGVRKVGPLAKLPQELFDRIIELVDSPLLGWKKARAMREELRKNRERIQNEVNEPLHETTFFYN